MTNEQPGFTPDNPSGDFPTRASRRRAAASPDQPRFADRFAPDPAMNPVAPEKGVPGEPGHPDDADVTVRRTPTDAPGGRATGQAHDASDAPAVPGTSGLPVFQPAIPAAPSAAPEAHGTPTGVGPGPDAAAARTEPSPIVRRRPSPAEQEAAAPSVAPDLAVPAVPVPLRRVPAPDHAPTGLRPREGRASFLAPDTAVVPAESGWRGVLARLGLSIPPSRRELAIRADVTAVSRHWPGPRTVAVVNGKGGANKTPTSVMLAAVFARNGGGPVLAWDNNDARGTLGWRTEQGPHEATVLDLLPQADALLAPSAQSALLARYVHHQTEDKFDVLRSKPDVLASQQKVTADDFDALHEVASKYFRLTVVDSGNDETAERWLRMIHHTDQLVIATTTLEEHAEAGALLLEALRARGGRYSDLARSAVVIVSQSDKNGTQAQSQSIADGFGELARRAVTIPFDAALIKGRIRYGALRPATQRAWLSAAAAVAEGL
ncbi:ATPase [Arthrobacter sp. B1805]|uniref:ATPase n=1 Tax=Arthrobacter sp. B1805 TaxID=2058892 RepID=UPI0015E28985|nr:ATPase [Arthrobacter sp. B1805]